MVGAAVPVDRVREGGQAEPAVPSRFPEARTLAALPPFLCHAALVYQGTLFVFQGAVLSRRRNIMLYV